MAPRAKTVASISVGKFFDSHAKALGLTLLGERVGFDRQISESAMNRPGLALAGFFTYFAWKRVQVLGFSELSYLRKLPDAMRVDRFRRMCDRDIPCVVVARGASLDDSLMAVANENNIPVFGTSVVTMNFLNTATIRLEHDFAPVITLHGCMVDMRGVGVLIMGKSGSGKSETAIGLLERGASLVADDMVRIKYVGGDLVASAPDLSRGYMEIRGIGIVNVANLYGLASIRPDKRLDLVVTLKPHADLNEVDRLGMQQKTYEILGQHVSHVEIPVAPGRDSARMVTIAALDQQLRRLGFNMADEFNQRLLDHMAGQK
ncbi:MAG: HPr(Ser) kinase/phosphatase [Luteolibacter sp.]|jgi:HPr kinase/phosphorylase|nr:HPr(Ser) kinase/phosphatase [Luteolibacter sp.]